MVRALKRAGYSVETTLVEPAGCDSRKNQFIDHPFEGISVGVMPPLLDWQLVNRTAWVHTQAMRNTQHDFAIRHGFFIGPTTAACIAEARQQITTTDLHCKVLVLAYDAGYWYF